MCALHLSCERGNTCKMRCAPGPGDRGTCDCDSQTPRSDPRNEQFVHCPQRWGKWRGVELGERTLSLTEAADQQKAPDSEISRVRGVRAIPMLAKRHSRGIECLRRPSQVTRRECDLGFRDNASRARHGLFRTKRTRRTPHEGLRASEIAQLRQRDTTKRKRRCVVAQRDAIQRAERVTSCQRTRRGRYERVHLDRVTLVSQTVRFPVLI